MSLAMRPNEVNTKVQYDCMAMSKCAAPEIEPDDIDVSDTVAFTWEIQ